MPAQRNWTKNRYFSRLCETHYAPRSDLHYAELRLGIIEHRTSRSIFCKPNRSGMNKSLVQVNKQNYGYWKFIENSPISTDEVLCCINSTGEGKHQYFVDWQLKRLCFKFAYHAFNSQTQKSLLTWSTSIWTNMYEIAEYCGRICGRRSKDFQDGAEGEGGRGLWRPPASNEETQAGRGGEKRDWRPRRWKAEGGGEGRQKEASPWHGVYRYLSTLFVQQLLAP